MNSARKSNTRCPVEARAKYASISNAPPPRIVPGDDAGVVDAVDDDDDADETDDDDGDVETDRKKEGDDGGASLSPAGGGGGSEDVAFKSPARVKPPSRPAAAAESVGSTLAAAALNSPSNGPPATGSALSAIAELATAPRPLDPPPPEPPFPFPLPLPYAFPLPLPSSFALPPLSRNTKCATNSRPTTAIFEPPFASCSSHRVWSTPLTMTRPTNAERSDGSIVGADRAEAAVEEEEEREDDVEAG